MANEFVARNGLIAQNNSTITGSLIVTAGITGSLLGTSSYVSGSVFSSINPALSASYAITSSYATTSSYTLSSSYSQTASLATTASYVLTASYALNISPLAFTGSYSTQSFTNLSTWTFNHGMDNRTPIIKTYDSSYNEIIPQNINLTSVGVATITFPTSESGFAIASLGGYATALNAVSASYARSASYASNATLASNATVTLLTSTPSTNVGIVINDFNFSQNTLYRASALTYNYASQSINATASWATTASYITSSFFTGINAARSASYAAFATSASYASGSTSASYALNASTIFPFNGTAIITGSLRITGSGIISTGSINITQGTYNVDGVNILDTALAYAIALG
jgi:hypothetical protein